MADEWKNHLGNASKRTSILVLFQIGTICYLHIQGVPKLQDNPEYAISSCKKRWKSPLPFCDPRLRSRNINSWILAVQSPERAVLSRVSWARGSVRSHTRAGGARRYRPTQAVESSALIHFHGLNQSGQL